jgi:hypothetical protein
MVTQCIRLLGVLGVLTGLPACAPIIALMGQTGSVVQVAVQLDRAKLAGDGLSYLRSGKTITDHAVSKVAGADCRLLNVVTPDPVCKPHAAIVADAANPRINQTALRDAVQQAESAFTAFPPGATADDGATLVTTLTLTPDATQPQTHTLAQAGNSRGE